jgi:hypothetical protein
LRYAGTGLFPVVTDQSGAAGEHDDDLLDGGESAELFLVTGVELRDANEPCAAATVGPADDPGGASMLREEIGGNAVGGGDVHPLISWISAS